MFGINSTTMVTQCSFHAGKFRKYIYLYEGRILFPAYFL